MKKIFLIAHLLYYSQVTLCQQASIDKFNIEREKINQTGLKIIAAYSAANIFYGTIAASNATGSNKYFYQMNVIWNGITLGIAGIGIIAAKKEGTISYLSSLKKQSTIEKVFLFNAGLDVAYIAGGAYINERSKTNGKNSLRQKGYGESIMLQGSVLFLFDGIMFLINNNHEKQLYKIGEKFKLSSTENGVGVVLNF